MRINTKIMTILTGWLVMMGILCNLASCTDETDIDDACVSVYEADANKRSYMSH